MMKQRIAFTIFYLGAASHELQILRAV